MVITKEKEIIKFHSAALDEDKKGNIILRGVIENESLPLLKVAPYQREQLPITRIRDLMKAFEAGGVPDIELGMRGGDCVDREDCFYLHDPTYIIDGLQRVTAAKQFLREVNGKEPRLGAVVHFNTSEDWERNRFRILNTTHLKLSPNILIRNMQKDYQIVDLMRTISSDRSFILNNKICWNQRMKREELITALTFTKVIGYLHGRFAATRTMRIQELILGLQKLYDKIGRGVVRDNIRTFWDLMDECYKVRYITFKEGAVYLRSAFLFMLAAVLSDHSNFWRDSRLFIEKDLRKKIASFPINDPEVVRLAGYGGGFTTADLLYQLMVNHINRGKTTKRLTPSKRNLVLTNKGKVFKGVTDVKEEKEKEDE